MSPPNLPNLPKESEEATVSAQDSNASQIPSTLSAPFPSRDELSICFAHVAYPLAEIFAKRHTGLRHFQVWSREDLREQIGDAHVLVVSGFWRNNLLEDAPNLRFIQSIGAGYDQFNLDALRQQAIRLASAKGVNLNAVSEHAIGMILALTRHLHTGRDHQHNHFWRGMISDLSRREDELGGKTLLIVGLGGIGSRLALLAKAFGMHVIATKRNPAHGVGAADELFAPDQLKELLPRADFVALTCPLTSETRNLIDAVAFAAMKPSAYLINVARGGCVDEPALLAALQGGQIAGAAIDHFWDEPLPAESPFWDLENVIITPHTAGETRRYEENLIDILLENLERLWRGETQLRNQVL
jgi:D-2-hydroxyacid dehydrogenase (NADP+)